MLTVDLRSDTVTKPTPEMLAAMVTAALGDDVLGDDPTVQELESLTSRLTGFEAALFMPSGTMSNQVALATHCRPGDAVVFERQAHMLYYEVGASGALSGVVSWTLDSDRGAIDPAELAKVVLREDIHCPGTKLLCLENTHNRHGGSVIPLNSLAALRQAALEREVAVHMDGARVYHAAVALGVDVQEILQHCDTVTICLSKGLRSPVGSLLCGSAEFIQRARRVRKRFGGGMRQSGLLAACGIVSLTTQIERLAEDHSRAQHMAQALSELASIRAEPERTETNLVLAHTIRPAKEWQDALHEKGVWCFPFGPSVVRFVWHADVGDPHLNRAVEVIRDLEPQMR